MLAKANRIDNSEEVEGYYHPRVRNGKYCISPRMFDIGKSIDDNLIDINPSTLKYKIGDEWYSEEQIEDAVNFTDGWDMFDKKELT